jgi:hypothetical protein
MPPLCAAKKAGADAREICTGAAVRKSRMPAMRTTGKRRHCPRKRAIQ